MKEKNISISRKTFASRIEEILKEAGSAEELSRRTNIAGASISGYKRGDNEPLRENLIALAKAADVELLWLATGEGPKRREREGVVQESPASYGHAATFKISEAMRMVAEILESGTSYSLALWLNIQHFDRALKAESRITQIETENKHLKDKLHKLEERFTALEQKITNPQEDLLIERKLSAG